MSPKTAKTGSLWALGAEICPVFERKTPVKAKCLPVRKLAECAALIDENSLKRLNSELRVGSGARINIPANV